MDSSNEDHPMDGSQPAAGPSTTTPPGEENVSQSIMNEIMKEQAYQELNTKLKGLQEKLVEEQAAREEVERKYQEEKATAEQLKAHSSTQISSFTSNTQAIENLKLQVDLLKGEKKELLEVAENFRKKSRTDNEQMSNLRDRFTQDSTRIRQLETDRLDAIGEKNSYEHNYKLLQDALKASQQESEMYAQKVIEKTAEFTRYRTQSESDLETLQVTLSSKSAELLSTTRSKTHLDSLYQKQAQQLSDANFKIQDLSSKLSTSQASFRTITDKQKLAIQGLEKDLTEAEKYIQSVQSRVDGIEKSKREEVAAAEEKVKAAQEAQERAQVKLVELEGIVSAAPVGLGVLDGSFSTTAAIVAEYERQGKDISEVFVDQVRLGNALAKQKLETLRMKNLLDGVFKDISEKAPILQEQRREYEALKVEANSLASSLSSAVQARDEAQQSLASLRQEHASADTERKEQQSQLADYGIQIRSLLRELAIRDDPQLAYEQFDPRGPAIVSQDGDIDTVITNNLVAYKNLPGLLEQNKTLLKISRKLGRQLEAKERELEAKANGAGEEDTDELMGLAQTSVDNLRDELTRVRGLLAEAKAQTDQYMKERDMFSQLLVHSTTMSTPSSNGSGAATVSTGGPLDSAIRSLQAEFGKFRERLEKDKAELQKQVQSKVEELAMVRKELGDKSISVEYYKGELGSKQDLVGIANQNILMAQQEAAREREAATLARSEKFSIIKEKDAAQSTLEAKVMELNLLMSQKITSDRLAEQAQKALSEANSKQADLAREIETRNLLSNSGKEAATQRQSALEKTIEDLREEIKVMRTKLQNAETLPQDTITQLNAQIRSHTAKITELNNTITENEAKYNTELDVQQKLVEKWQASDRNKNNIGLRFKAQVVAAEARVKALEEENVTLNEKVKVAEEAVAAKQQQVDTLTAQVTTSDTNLEAANALVLSLQAQVLSATGAKPVEDTAGKQRIAALEAQVQTLTAAAAASAAAPAPTSAQPMEVDPAQVSPELAELRTQLESKQAEQKSLLELLKPLQSPAQAEADLLKLDDPQSWGDFLRGLAPDLVTLRAKSERYTEVVKKANKSNESSVAAKNNALKRLQEVTEELNTLKATVESQSKETPTPTPAPEPVVVVKEESTVTPMVVDTPAPTVVDHSAELETLKATNVTLKQELEKAKADLSTATTELEKLKTEAQSKDTQIAELTVKAEKAATAEATMASAQELEARSRAKMQQLENKLKKAQAQLVAAEKNEKERKGSVSAETGAAISIKGSSAAPATPVASTSAVDATTTSPVAAGTRAGAAALRGLSATPSTPVPAPREAATRGRGAAVRGAAVGRGRGRGRGSNRPQVGSNMDILSRLNAVAPSTSTPTTGIKRTAPTDESPPAKAGEDASKRQKVEADPTTKNGSEKPEGS